MKVKKQELCYPVYLCGAKDCLLRRNTLLSLDGRNIVVSSVGMNIVNDTIYAVGHRRLAETKAFEAIQNNGIWEVDIINEVDVKTHNIIPGMRAKDWPHDAEVLFDKQHEMNVRFVARMMRQEWAYDISSGRYDGPCGMC